MTKGIQDRFLEEIGFKMSLEVLPLSIHMHIRLAFSLCLSLRVAYEVPEGRKHILFIVMSLQ